MKKFLVILAIVISCFAHYGCNGCANDMKHLTSEFSGLNRVVTLYSGAGAIIGQWDITSTVEDKGGSTYFLDANGKAIYISGTYTIIEK